MLKERKDNDGVSVCGRCTFFIKATRADGARMGANAGASERGMRGIVEMLVTCRERESSRKIKPKTGVHVTYPLAFRPNKDK